MTTLANANKTAMSNLYKLGAFEILLWKLLDGDVVEWDKTRIAKFLAQCHLLQVSFSLGPTRYLFLLIVKYRNHEIFGNWIHLKFLLTNTGVPFLKLGSLVISKQ